MSVDEIRRRIDAIDRRIVVLLDKRAQLAQRVAREKQKEGKPIFDPQRVDAVLHNVEKHARVLTPSHIRAIYTEIIGACTDIQQPFSIAFLGPYGTFSHQAAVSLYGSSARGVPCATIEEVFDSVEKGTVTVGVVPIENSTEGTVNSTLDLLRTHELFIIHEVVLPIRHALIAPKGVRLKDIQTVVSHPHALAQAKRFIQSHGWKTKETVSTARACQEVKRTKTSAAIASPFAAHYYGLSVLARDVQDQSSNATRFVVLSKTPRTSLPSDVSLKTSIIFSLRNEPGALFDVLSVFASKNINLTKIESRPAGSWSYDFFVDYESADTNILSEIGKKTASVRLLGTYPSVHVQPYKIPHHTRLIHKKKKEDDTRVHLL